MRIAFDVAQTCGPKAACGWAADLLAKALAESAPDDEFYLYHHFGTWLNPDTSGGTRLQRPNTKEPFRHMTIGEARELWAAVASGNGELPGSPEIVHANCYQAPKVGSAKLVYTVYDMSFWTHPEYTTEVNRLVCQQGTLDAVSRAVGFVFISQSTRSEFERIFPKLRARQNLVSTVAPLASRFAVVAHPRGEISSRAWLAVGSLEPRKNYGTLLDALEQYSHRSKHRRPLVIAGGSGWKSELLRQRIQEMGQRGLVRYLGYVSGETLNRLYREAFALVFPSHHEGFGLPIVEALSQGCPVITGRNTSLEEAGGSAALYYDATSEDLARSMLELENHPDLYLQKSSLALTQARKFDWKITAKNVLGLYRQLLS
ncbi:MAG: glycosyltransferase family 4 protein [Verrucomicrobia bacterium]|nr:glycosyltransferase family 4 protein [Verrucomicrobiota bacterium]